MMKDVLLMGFGYADLGLFLQRFVLGVFFVTYRFRWVFDPSDPDGCYWFSPRRNKRLRGRLCSCGYTDHKILAAAVALTEIAAGLGLIVGFLSTMSAFGIFTIMLFANCCTPPEEIPQMHPVDKLDYVPCYLKMVEPLYLLLSLNVILIGPGRWSLDYYLSLVR